MGDARLGPFCKALSSRPSLVLREDPRTKPSNLRPGVRVPLVVWAWDLLLCGFFAAVSRPLPTTSFSLCDLRLFVILNARFPTRAFEALGGGAGAAVPPAPAANLPVAGAALALPPLAVPSAPVVQAVAVSAGGVSYAGVPGGRA